MELLDVPFLIHGGSDHPSEGGCIMQIIDWIDRGSWTDEPRCVHSAIRCAAIEVNDEYEDGDRQRLLDLIPRMMGTNPGDAPDVSTLTILAQKKMNEIHTTEDHDISWLLSLLDAYDELRPRKVEPVDLKPVTEMLNLARV